MRAIKEAIAKRNRKFLGQYGGLIQAGERYKELLKLPEAELTEGVSIDECSTYRATRFAAIRFDVGRFGAFFMELPKGRMLFVTGTKGGVEHKKAWRWNSHHIP